MPDQHRCRRGHRCPDRETDTTTAQVLGALVAEPGLCRRDERLLTKALDELPELWLSLRSQIRPSMAASSGGPSGTRTPPMPLRAEPLVAAEAVHDELVLWATLVRAATNMRARRDVVPATVPAAERSMHAAASAVASAASLLSRTVDVLLGLPARQLQRWDPSGSQLVTAVHDGIDGAVALLNLHQRATTAAGRRRLVHFLPTPCPHCESTTLQREDGADEVQCLTCGNVWPEAHYRFLTRLAAEDYAWAWNCPECDQRGRRLDDPAGSLCNHPPITGLTNDSVPAAPADESAEAGAR